MRTVWFCEQDVPVPVPYVDVLCGGFPCQDISLAGRGAGLAGERSGLWREFARLIGELRPRYVIVENVPALTSRGLDVVLADLAACGFDAEWDHLPASAFGAPHRRDRIWLVAYPGGPGNSGGTAGKTCDGCQDTHEGRPLDDAVRGQYGAPEGQLRAGRDDSLDASAGGSLNPTWVEWLLGFPLGWTNLTSDESPSESPSESTDCEP
jgi:site-specific DNA-cytosine methylase